MDPAEFYEHAVDKLHEEQKKHAIAWYHVVDIAAFDRTDQVIKFAPMRKAYDDAKAAGLASATFPDPDEEEYPWEWLYMFGPKGADLQTRINAWQKKRKRDHAEIERRHYQMLNRHTESHYYWKPKENMEPKCGRVAGRLRC